MKISFKSIVGGYNLSQINVALQDIVDHLNNKVLYRVNVSNEPNQLETDIDANGKTIYNLAAPTEDHQPATKQYVDEKALDLAALTQRVEALEQLLTNGDG